MSFQKLLNLKCYSSIVLLMMRGNKKVKPNWITISTNNSNQYKLLVIFAKSKNYNITMPSKLKNYQRI